MNVTYRVLLGLSSMRVHHPAPSYISLSFFFSSPLLTNVLQMSLQRPLRARRRAICRLASPPPPPPRPLSPAPADLLRRARLWTIQSPVRTLQRLQRLTRSSRAPRRPLSPPPTRGTVRRAAPRFGSHPRLPAPRRDSAPLPQPPTRRGIVRSLGRGDLCAASDGVRRCRRHGGASGAGGEPPAARWRRRGTRRVRLVRGEGRVVST